MMPGTPAETTRLLRETTLFAACTEGDLDRLSEIALRREFRDGDVLFSLGQMAEELLVISSGAVQLELPVSVLGKERHIAFETKKRGGIVGWSSLAPNGRFTLSGRAAGKTEALAFRRQDLAGLFEKDPELGCRVLRNALLVATLRLQRSHAMWAGEIQEGLDKRYR